MNNSREKFEAFDSSYYRFLDTKPTYEKLAVFEKQDPYTIVYADHDVQVRFLNFTAAWLAATEQSQKEIEALQAREKVLVEALGTAQDELTHLSHHTREDYARDCVNKIFNSIEQALANVNNAKKG